MAAFVRLADIIMFSGELYAELPRSGLDFFGKLRTDVRILVNDPGYGRLRNAGFLRDFFQRDLDIHGLASLTHYVFPFIYRKSIVGICEKLKK